MKLWCYKDECWPRCLFRFNALDITCDISTERLNLTFERELLRDSSMCQDHWFNYSDVVLHATFHLEPKFKPHWAFVIDDVVVSTLIPTIGTCLLRSISSWFCLSSSFVLLIFAFRFKQESWSSQITVMKLGFQLKQ